MDITPGHWIFAFLFLISFIAILSWSFMKDKKVNKPQFGNVGLIALIIGGSIIMLIIIKFALRNINH